MRKVLQRVGEALGDVSVLGGKVEAVILHLPKRAGVIVPPT